MERKSFTYKFLILIIALAMIGMSCNLLNHLADSTPESITPETNTPGLGDTPGSTTEESASPTTPSPSPTPPIPLSQGPRFAVFEESIGSVTAGIHHELIAPDLSNVQNPFILSKAQLEYLTKNGFVVSPGNEKEFFSLYEKARYDNVPIFVSSDSLLHSYHLLFDKILRTAETEHFSPLLNQLNQALLAKADEQYQILQSTDWGDAARRTVAYFGVGSKLLDPNVAVPAYAVDLVQAELSLIEQAAGILPSPIFPGYEYGEDYTQYIPRGHYTKSELLKAYFKSMMWYGRMSFRLKSNNPDTGKAETRAALLVTQALRNTQVNGQPAIQAWADLYAPTVFFVGRSDDLTVIQYGDVIDFVYGPNVDLNTLADDTKLDQFIDLAYQLPPPKILGMVISDEADESLVTKGLRFMGQRFVPDAYIFRQLIYRNVGTQTHRRGLPKGLDLMAAMGSQRAYQLLEQLGDAAYENYPQQMEKVKSWLSTLTVPEWTETLNNTWLYTFFPLLDVPDEGYPDFMNSTAWLDKQLNSCLGSWTELKHDTILYAKQVYAEMGGGPQPPKPLPPRGYVEPVPQFYARLSALTSMTRTGLESRGLLSEADRDGLARLEDMSNAFQGMAEKELRGSPLTDDEYERIRFYGGELEHLVFLSADIESQAEEVGSPQFMTEDQQAAVIADVATDPDPSGSGAGGPVVLEEAVGRIFEIHAIVPVTAQDGSLFLQVAKGGVFSYYEFTWPANDRLTDEKWRQILDSNQAPPLPSWLGSFYVTEGGYAEIGRGVSRFQNDISNLYWDPGNWVFNLDASTEQFKGQLDALNAAKQYMGHQLYASYFRSFDLQSPTQAVVTVRESWKDTLYGYSGDWPNYDESAIAERGPYNLDVSYVLQYIQEGSGPYWKVIQVVFNNQPPSF